LDFFNCGFDFVLSQIEVKKKFFLFLSIIILAAILRFWNLDKVPPELFGDELDVGYQAYSLLSTGKDYYGQPLPFYIHSFSEWRAPLLMYVTAPFIKIFGLNEWGVRLPSAFFGVLSVAVLFLLVRKTIDEKAAFVSAFFLAISQWHLQYSRAAFEVSLLLFLFLMGIYIFILSFKTNWFLLFSAFFFGLTIYTYSTANVFLPLILVLLVLLYQKQLKKIPKRFLAISGLILMIMILPVAKEIIFGHASERFGLVSIFNQKEFIDKITIQRNEGNLGTVEKFFHNRPFSWIRAIGLNYLSVFSPLFLLERGDITFRHSIHEMGEIYWVQYFLFFLGIFYLLTRAEKNRKLFWLGWLFLAPIPSSLTYDGATHASRLILILPPMLVISALGGFYVYDLLRSRFQKVLLVGFLSSWLILGFIFYMHRYYVHYSKESWRWWQVGYKEAMQFMKTKEKDYKIIAFNNSYEPTLIRFLFWWQYPPEKFHKEFKSDQPINEVLKNFNGFSLENRYYFGIVKQSIPSFMNQDKIIYLVSYRDEIEGLGDWEKNPPADIKILKTIYNPYKEPIFYIIALR
jgi:4-amino-4-deoxy-L-arabinose transferase-like glycosyltransferase